MCGRTGCQRRLTTCTCVLSPSKSAVTVSAWSSDACREMLLLLVPCVQAWCLMYLHGAFEQRRSLGVTERDNERPVAIAAYAKKDDATASLVTLEQSILPGFIPPKPLDRFIKGAGLALVDMVMGNCCWQSALSTDFCIRVGLHNSSCHFLCCRHSGKANSSHYGGFAGRGG